MKYIKTISCLILFAISFSVSAEIKLRSSAPNLRPEYRVRTVTPNFSVNDTKHNQRINNIANDFAIQKTDVSYLSIENNQYTTSRRNRMTSKNTNYYQRYSPVYSQSTNISYNNHITVKSYNVANRAPFEGDAASVQTSSSKYSQFGPPEEGPISDVIWPLLLCIGIYILGKTKK
jgi:hypothetical protein